MLLVQFTIPGKLRGKGRARAGIRKGKSGQQFVQVYADKNTVNAEAMVRQIGADAMAGRPPFEGPLILSVALFLNTTASWSKRKRRETIYVTGKPDLDNIVKLIGDALNKIVWADDQQICGLNIFRSYDDSRGECAEIFVSRPSMPVATVAPKPVHQQYELAAAPLFARSA